MMKIFLLALLFVSPTGLAVGQYPPIGVIDSYGLRTVSEEQIRQALRIKEGDDSSPEFRDETQRRLEMLPHVQQARLSYVCCEAGKSILYVGVRENGSPSLSFRAAPKGVIRLPETIRQAGQALDEALTEGILKGDIQEDDSQGHALNSYPKARAIQERFITFAVQDLKLLRAVLHEASDTADRALAAEIIGYAANKREVVKDLVYGMTDPDPDVRNNSMRALAVIAVFAQLAPKQRIRVPVKPFIDLLNSIVWTDRNKSSFALYQLTGKSYPAVLSELRKRALPSLVEMSRWKTGHALFPFFLLGRVGGLSESEIQKEWDSGNREALIEKVLRKGKSE